MRKKGIQWVVSEGAKNIIFADSDDYFAPNWWQTAYYYFPAAYVSKHAAIEEGAIVMHYALVNAGAKIGSNCIINSKALIEHDAIIGDHCHIATGAIINGGTIISLETFVGSNAMTKEYIEIGEQTVIGGVSVLQSVSPKNILKNR